MSDFNGKPFKEAMCIEAMRVFDSCSSQDCLEDAFERGAALITADAVPALDDETFRIAEAVYNKNFAL